jgi:riboflavin biosynthesis pyrimidine reductase
VIVIGPPGARDRAAETLDIPHVFVPLAPDSAGRVRLGDALSALADRGAPRIVSEGGPSLAAALIADGLVGELCLSTSPRLTGAGMPVLGTRQHPAVGARLAGLMLDDAGGLYARWELSPEP